MWIAGTAVFVLVTLVVGGLVRIRRRLVLVDVKGDSMRPALAAGNRVLVGRVRPADVRVGQIGVIEHPHRDLRGWTCPSGGVARGLKQWMITRVAAVPVDPVRRVGA